MKVLNPANEEAAIIDRLQHDRSTRNHLIPCEIVRSDPTLLVMPSVPDIDGPIRRAESPLMKFCTILKVFHQIAEVRSIHTSHVPVCSHTGDRVSITYILSTSHTSYAPFHFLRALLTVVRTPRIYALVTCWRLEIRPRKSTRKRRRGESTSLTSTGHGNWSGDPVVSPPSSYHQRNTSPRCR